MCHMQGIFLFVFNLYFYKVMKLVGGGSVINGATPSSFILERLDLGLRLLEAL